MTHACAVRYPQEFPLECVKEIVRIVRQRSLAAERAAFAQHAWVVQGYLQDKLLGAPVPTLATTELNDDAACVAFEDLVAASEGKSALPLPVVVLLRWLLEKLLDAFLENRSGD